LINCGAEISKRLLILCEAEDPFTYAQYLLRDIFIIIMGIFNNGRHLMADTPDAKYVHLMADTPCWTHCCCRSSLLPLLSSFGLMQKLSLLLLLLVLVLLIVLWSLLVAKVLLILLLLLLSLQ
jgi:hypothetical protein